MADCSSSRVSSNSVVLHILVVDFHHQKGATVTFLHPPLSSSSTDNLTLQLPQAWRHVPHIALPDGCHNYDQGSVYFALPSLEVSMGTVYGVACFRQVEAKDLQQDAEVTRSTVQKSVCVLSRVPLFGYIEAKLNIVTHAYFNGKFTDVAILVSAYDDLNVAINPHMALTVCHVGLCPSDQVERYQHKLLQIFKAMLLRSKVLVYGSSSGNVSKCVMSMASLLPLCIEGLIDLASTGDCYGFPLHVFPFQSSLQPYLSLQQMDLIVAMDTRLLLTGAVNPLFEKQKTKLCDVFVNMETGVVDILSQDLLPLLHLTSADLRFCSLLSSGVRGDSSPVSPHSTAGWYGSHDWVRMQFKMYLLSLLATCHHGDSVSMEHFNAAFVLAWIRSPVYKVWAASSHEDLSKVTPTHLCEGQLSMGDLKRRLYVQMSDYGLSLHSSEQVTRVLHGTQQVLASTAGRVSSAVSGIWSAAASWWTGGSFQDSLQDDS